MHASLCVRVCVFLSLHVAVCVYVWVRECSCVCTIAFFMYICTRPFLALRAFVPACVRVYLRLCYHGRLESLPHFKDCAAMCTYSQASEPQLSPLMIYLLSCCKAIKRNILRKP